MRSSSTSSAENQQETYIRARDNALFEGMRRGEAATMEKGSVFTVNGKVASRSILRAASDIGSKRTRKILSQVLEDPIRSPLENSASDIVLEPFDRSSSGTWLGIPEPRASPLPELHSDLQFNFEDVNELREEFTPKACEANEECETLTVYAKPQLERSYTINKRKVNLSKVPLPPTAALFYNGHSPQMEVIESCTSIYRLNMYLKARKQDVRAGVPGKFLRVVIGPDISDIGSVASTIVYAFYLNEIQESKQFCTVPIINTKRADMESHAELQWLLDSCHIDQSSLLFVDEIDLFYYDLFGSLKLVLVNCSKLPAKQEALKEALIEIFDCRKSDNAYPWVENVTSGEEVSCCTLIAEKFALTSPEILAGQGFSRLLLAGILLDTGNLKSPLTTSKDKYMATLLINGAGRFGCNGLYQILRYKMYDVSELRIEEILRKDLRKWTRIGKLDSSSRLTVSNIGMSSTGISVPQLLALDSTSDANITHFQRLEKLSLLVIVSGYYDTEKNFKREILISAESPELLKNLVHFINSSAPELPLKVLHPPDLRSDKRAFEVDRVTSRKTIERLLEEFIELSK